MAKQKPAVNRGFLHRAGKAALKGSASAAMGASVAIVEVDVSEQAAKALRAAMALAGLAGEIFINPDENPMLSETAKASLHSATSITLYKVTHNQRTESKKLKEETDHDKMVAQLKKDMQEPDQDAAAKKNGKLASAKQTVPVPTTTKAADKTPDPAQPEG